MRSGEEEETPETEFLFLNPWRMLFLKCPDSNHKNLQLQHLQHLHQASLDLIGAKGLECNSLASELEAHDLGGKNNLQPI